MNDAKPGYLYLTLNGQHVAVSSDDVQDNAAVMAALDELRRAVGCGYVRAVVVAVYHEERSYEVTLARPLPGGGREKVTTRGGQAWLPRLGETVLARWLPGGVFDVKPDRGEDL